MPRIQRPSDYPCLCQCGERTLRYFRRGHVSRFRNWLKRARHPSVAAPEHVMPRDVAEALGPWRQMSRGGWLPATTNYKVLRPYLRTRKTNRKREEN